jgi:ribose transport system permease protein
MKQTKQRSRWLEALVQYVGLVVALAVMVGIFGAMSRNFWNAQTASSIANSIPDLAIVSVGMTLVLIVGGIDLSVGSVMALCSAVVAVAMERYKIPVPIACLVGGGVGMICGLLNGWTSVAFRIPSFIITLGMLEIARGATYLVTDSKTVYVGSVMEWITEPLVVGLSPAFLLSIVIVVLGQLLLDRTVLGRIAIAIGTNPETVKMSGLRVTPYTVSIFGICGLLCSIAGVIQTSRLSASDPNGGIGLELLAIAACVIGGTSLKGGRGSVFATFLGVLIVSVLQSGLAQLGVPDPLKRIITGAVIIAAVLIDAWRKKNAS